MELVNGRTSLLISQRFSTVRMADRIAVLENRVITECGTHGELIAEGELCALVSNAGGVLPVKATDPVEIHRMNAVGFHSLQGR